jgi:iron(III) transport system substrate-binding protein
MKRMAEEPMLALRRMLTGALCVALATLATSARADEKALYETAKGERSITWYISHYSGELAQDVASAFTAKYPGVVVNVVRTTAQVAYQRLNQDKSAGNANCDVFSSTDIGHYATLRERGLLAWYVPEGAAKLSPEFLKYSHEGYDYPTSAGLVMITYNKSLVRPQDVPKNWPELLDPKWRNKIALGHPAFSGYVGTWAIQMRKLYGKDYFKRLEKNKPHIGRSINDTVTMLNSGERLIAAGPDLTTMESAARGNPVAITYPTDGVVLLIGPSAIMKNAPHPNAARLFVEFLMSPEYSRLLVQTQAMPMRSDVNPPPGMKPLSEIKVVRPSDEEIIAGMTEAIEEWRDVFGN